MSYSKEFITQKVEDIQVCKKECTIRIDIKTYIVHEYRHESKYGLRDYYTRSHYAGIWV